MFAHTNQKKAALAAVSVLSTVLLLQGFDAQARIANVNTAVTASVGTAFSQFDDAVRGRVYGDNILASIPR
jgi:hypothetical protein